jgi:hypothetical protein
MPQPNSVPDWVKETPRECEYNLIMWDSGGDNVEEIHLSRCEYEAAKQKVAQMRGYLAPTPNAPATSPETLKVEFRETFKATLVRTVENVVSAASPDDLLVLGCLFNELAAGQSDVYGAVANVLGREAEQSA